MAWAIMILASAGLGISVGLFIKPHLRAWLRDSERTDPNQTELDWLATRAEDQGPR